MSANKSCGDLICNRNRCTWYIHKISKRPFYILHKCSRGEPTFATRTSLLARRRYLSKPEAVTFHTNAVRDNVLGACAVQQHDPVTVPHLLTRPCQVVTIAGALIQRVGVVTSYVPDGIHSDDSDRGDSPPPLESIYDVDEEEPPPSTEPRSDDRGFATIYPSLEHNMLIIWLHVIVVMEETGRGYDTPHVDVRFMTRFQDDDLALRRIGLIIERVVRGTGRCSY
ncbi:hypothetical protein LXA43DRAFT_1067173 [Ganoderma leucocontextum]|nr:hypothetical protein LXA43DRAFT_1067173 [Ganoderma leucocontextum]